MTSFQFILKTKFQMVANKNLGNFFCYVCLGQFHLVKFVGQLVVLCRINPKKHSIF